MLSTSSDYAPSPVALPCAPQGAQRPSRLLTGIYHDIGMAAVALGLDLPLDSLEPAAHESVRRGNRYIYLMPRREPAPAAE